MADIDLVGRIVVGIDGSEASKDALRWAVRQAKLTGAPIEAVMAWEFPAYYGWAPADDFDLAEVSRDALRAAVDDALGVERTAQVRQVVAEGNPARVLIDAAKDASLLVVGSRGHGGFAGALLGSVSQHCAQHAPCPVVVVRHTA
ncbi:universal stress protein [Phytohabitans sp. ZYX-F-186]|uniref:Universal stress protein n=1 Tax=Phytohabitans maris TaxID=3071409 RepID=A0ABU0ZPP7_9ACTN|nr:universal stress protein [Phytohabitans sp. ZYX-F-186]MDQ7908997.1 universal stress protein [Phytohabitans sp. ZYX-F-186]